MIRVYLKYFYYFIASIITLFIFYLYYLQNVFIITFGILPWLLIEFIWYFAIKFSSKIEIKTLNLLFSSLYLFTVFLPFLELLFFKSNFFSINKIIIYLLQTETAFFILYILFLIFFLLYFLVSIIFYLNFNIIAIVKKEDFYGYNTNSFKIKSIILEKDNIKYKFQNNNFETLKDKKILNLPEINIKPFIPDERVNDEKSKDKSVYINATNEITKEFDVSIEKLIEEKLNEDGEENIEKIENWKIKENVNDKIEQILIDNIERNNEDNIEKKIKGKIERNIERNIDGNEEGNIERIIEKNIEKKEENLSSLIKSILPELSHANFNIFSEDNKIIEEKGAIILKTLKDFGIESKLLNYIKGPVVTRFELEIDEKVNLGKIINLEKNITYNLSAEKIRILAPIPGKKAVGIEIPNEIKQIVYFKDLVRSDEFIFSNMHLPFILGKDIEGKIIITDLSKSPHLLIAGRTGSGKSVCINTLIASLVIANPPEKVRLILIDPKRVELSLYNELPHLLTDEIIIFPEDASAALKWLVAEMEKRYSILKENGFRSIEDYNSHINEKLPYLVLIIDEFYALMQTSQKIIEDSLIHLSAMARAVGIHLVFATQRPSAEVVTGVIKSNLPSRIAFQTFSKTDSRIILDSAGAESLLGNGDMLFSFAGLEPVRIQGAFISTNEVKTLVKNISEKYNAERKSIEDLFSEIKKENNISDNDIDDDDPLYSQAIEIVKRERKVSASYLQRRLKIGYNRAARIVEKMEEEGLISPIIDGKRREIYI